MADCKATLRIEHATFICDLEAPHPGLAHGNKEARAIWCSDGEAKRHGKKGQS